MRAPPPLRHSFRRAAITLVDLFRGGRGGDPELTAEFLRLDRSRGRNGARAFCQVAIVLLCASEAVSYVAGGPAAALLGIRSTAVVALLAIHWLLGTHLGMRRSRELALLSVLVMASTIEALAVPTGGPASYQHDRLNLLVLGTAVLLTWPRAWSALAGAMVLAIYLGGALGAGGLPAGQRHGRFRDHGHARTSSLA
jgi:hypothetical protein